MSDISPPPPPPMPMGGGGSYGGSDHPQGTTILVLGILSLVACSPLGIFAWIMGNKARAEIAANPSAYRNSGIINAGWICGIISTCLLGLVLVAFLLIGVLGAGQL